MAVKTLQPSGADAVIEFSIFTENKVGRLNGLIHDLAESGTHIVALSTLDTTDCAIVRIVADYPEVAEKALKAKNYAYASAPVLAIELLGEHELRKVTCGLEQAEINIHHYYPFLVRPHNRAGLVMRVEDPDLAEDVLKRHGLTLLRRGDIAR